MSCAWRTATAAADVLVHVGLGTNLGDRHQNLDAAIEGLRALGRVGRASRRYESAPVGYLEQPRFLNQVVELDTELAPLELLRALKDLERTLGRTAAFRNAPRIIDLDILLVGDVVLRDPALEIPHPRLAERAFVLRPLAELVDHVLDTPIAELLEGVSEQDAEAVGDA